MRSALTYLKSKAHIPLGYLRMLFLWTLVASLIGGLTGLVGGAFHLLLELVTELRTAHFIFLYFLPAAGLFTVFLYHVTKMRNNRGMTTVMESVRLGKGVPLLTVPLIFVSTAVTHLFGGSAGREGAALQLGAGLGAWLGSLFRFRERDVRIALLCGMSGAFAALFGTPMTAVFFAVEFVSVGVIYYSGIYSCIVSSIVSVAVARLLGVHHIRYETEFPPLDLPTLFGALGLAILLALLGILFCTALHQGEAAARFLFSSPYLRIFLLGSLLVLLTLLFGTDYNGASEPLLAAALAGKARGYDFILKLVFTVVTIAAGYRGGEIVPTFCIGACFGAVIAPIFGLSPAFAAALGVVGLFSAVTNAPIASILLAYELFGGDRLICYALVALVCFLFSGNFSLYKGQKFVFSKRLGGFDAETAGEVLGTSEPPEGRRDHRDEK